MNIFTEMIDGLYVQVFEVAAGNDTRYIVTIERNEKRGEPWRILLDKLLTNGTQRSAAIRFAITEFDKQCEKYAAEDSRNN